MSRLAKGLLILAILSATLGCFTTENTLGDAPLVACGVFPACSCWRWCWDVKSSSTLYCADPLRPQ